MEKKKENKEAHAQDTHAHIHTKREAEKKNKGRHPVNRAGRQRIGRAPALLSGTTAKEPPHTETGHRQGKTGKKRDQRHERLQRI
jgi:hypothetical protein